MTTADLQAMIDAEAKRIAAFNDHEQTWEDCPQAPGHRKGHYCEHQVTELANHLTRNRVQREDAQRQALVKALERIATFSDVYGPTIEASIAQDALAGLEPAQPPSARFFRNEAGVLDEHRNDMPEDPEAYRNEKAEEKP